MHIYRSERMLRRVHTTRKMCSLSVVVATLFLSGLLCQLPFQTPQGSAASRTPEVRLLEHLLNTTIFCSGLVVSVKHGVTKPMRARDSFLSACPSNTSFLPMNTMAWYSKARIDQKSAWSLFSRIPSDSEITYDQRFVAFDTRYAR